MLRIGIRKTSDPNTRRIWITDGRHTVVLLASHSTIKAVRIMEALHDCK